MLKAKDIMTKEIISVYPETEVIQAARLMLEHHINGLPVIDEEGRLKGIICQSDLVTQQKKIPLPSFFIMLDSYFPLTSHTHIEKELQKIAAVSVADAMTPDPVTVGPETALEDIATLMVKNNIHTLPVVDKGKLVGIIGKEDILRTLMVDAKLDSGSGNDWPEQGVCSSPAVEGKRLYYVSNRGELICLDTEGYMEGKNRNKAGSR
jgi:CBS domain-containing protein